VNILYMYVGTERRIHAYYIQRKTGAPACHLGRRPECWYPTPFIIIFIFYILFKEPTGVRTYIGTYLVLVRNVTEPALWLLCAYSQSTRISLGDGAACCKRRWKNHDKTHMNYTNNILPVHTNATYTCLHIYTYIYIVQCTRCN